MFKLFKTILIAVCFFFLSGLKIYAQQVLFSSDSFFLAKKKGILGRLGRSISTNGAYIEPVKTVDPYKKYHGKIIRSITVVPVGFNCNLNDTTPIKTNLAVRIANGLHRNSFERVITKNLFFKRGQPFYPLVVADNERFLREQDFLRDALIKVLPAEYSTDSVDVIVLTRDVFSIGGSGSVSNLDRVKSEVREENLGGSGNRLAFFGLLDKNRIPDKGFGAEYLQRNIKGSFINWANGFKTFAPAFSSGRLEEINIYSQIEKPMASRYTAVTGAAKISLHSTINGYVADSLYSNDIRYRYVNTDIWAGYNFGHSSGKKKDSENRLRHFVAMRAFYNIFSAIPQKYVSNYNYQYADINGVLIGYSLYRQNFYRTNFIYGFGRNEDIPDGINATIIGGYTNKQGVKRAYYGVEMDGSKFTKKEGLFSYNIKVGGYLNEKKLQDVDILLGLNHITKLHKFNSHWYNRCYLGMSYTRQIQAVLNEPLFLQSEFGLPFFNNRSIQGAMRTTFKAESVFYNTKKIFGFRLAPFVFTNLALIEPVNEPLKKTNGYPALGAGVRTRNESLVFGTVEVRGYVFPRVSDGMQNWKLEISTKLRFKYNSSFIRRPDFIRAN